MEQMKLSECGFSCRADAVAFLKTLWAGKSVPCPICGNPLELLHRKAKRDTADWQCRICDKTVKTISILTQLNEQMPN